MGAALAAVLIAGIVSAGLRSPQGAWMPGEDLGTDNGAIVGDAAGTLYGLDRATISDKRATAAYRTGMPRRGYY